MQRRSFCQCLCLWSKLRTGGSLSRIRLVVLGLLGYLRLHLAHVIRSAYVSEGDPVIAIFHFLTFDLILCLRPYNFFLLISTYPASSCNHECANAKPRYLPRRDAT